MQQREFPLVVKKNGKRFIPTFPVTLNEGDQFILVQEVVGIQVPENITWVLAGYYWGSGGPLIPQHEVVEV